MSKKQNPSRSHSLASTDSSLGILPSEYVNFDSFNDVLKKQVDLARKSIDRVQSFELPSRLLRRDMPTSPSLNQYTKMSSASTISESDFTSSSRESLDINVARDANMLYSRHFSSKEYKPQTKSLNETNFSAFSEKRFSPPSQTSTPRESLASNADLGFSRRFSAMSDIFRNGNDLKQCFSNVDSGMFQSSSSFKERLKSDEESYNKKNFLATSTSSQPKEFSTTSLAPDMSIGSYFLKRSDDLSFFLPKSPDDSNQATPVPLVDLTNTMVNESTLSVSKIANILADTEQTPSTALNRMLKKQKKSIDYSSISFDEEKSEKQLSRRSLSRSPRPSSPRPSSPPTKEIVHLKDYKENMILEKPQKNNQHDKSTSSCSSSSSALTEWPPGKVPIATSKSEIIWGCLKLGKQVTQHLMIKNKADRRLIFKCSVSNLSFKLDDRLDGTRATNEVNMVLQANETRKLNVMFAPTRIGACVDRILFLPINSTGSEDPKHEKQHIRLFGYGGHTAVSIQDVPRDTNGKFFISMGDFTREPITRNFSVMNSGNLAAFLFIEFVPNNSFWTKTIRLNPELAVLPPNGKLQVQVECRPTRDEFQHLTRKNTSNGLIDFGKINIAYGSEVDRGRLRKVIQLMEKKKVERSKSLDNLIVKFPDEKMPLDLYKFRESVGAFHQMISFIDLKYIAVQADRCESSTIFDVTTMFNTLLCEESTMIVPSSADKQCVIRPEHLTLKKPLKTHDLIFLDNTYKKKVYFEIISEPSGLDFAPQSGLIKPKDQEAVTVSLPRNDLRIRENYVIKVLIDNEEHDVIVKVL